MPQNHHHIATVYWVSPQHGGYADPDKKMLSVGDLSDDTNYLSFDNTHGEERYLFGSQPDAQSFKSKIEDGYRKDPQYSVIDKNGNEVLEDGKPLVAWEPRVEIAAASSEDLEYYFEAV